jgi:Mg2+ and Co2+ transporter CorA
MAKTTEHLKKFSELSRRITALGDSIKKAEKDMQSVWVDQVEKIDLRDVKEHMKAVENALRLLEEEVSHMEAEHGKEAKGKQ